MDLGSPTGVYDIDGRQIMLGDRLRFLPHSEIGKPMDEEWEADTTFRDGCVTIEWATAKQIRNPSNWDQGHDWIKSRNFSCTVGISEFGVSFRQPITRIAHASKELHDKLTDQFPPRINAKIAKPWEDEEA